MAGKRFIGEDKRKGIVERFIECGNVATVSEEFDVADQTVRNILDEYGVERKHRKTQKNRKKSIHARVCKNCGKTTEHAGAKYCWWCGNDIRDPLEVAITAFEKAFRAVLIVSPATMKDETLELRNDVKKELSEKHE